MQETNFNVQIWDIVSNIPDGQFIGLIGHTGSGKSTLVQLFNAFYKFIFDDYTTYEYQSKCYNIFGYKDHKLRIYKLLVLEINGIYYYYLEDGKKFSYYTRDDLLKEFMKRNIRITEFTDIIGLYGFADMYKMKMK